MIKETTIPADMEAQVLFDAVHEPHEICKWDKRRKCDSYYISLYKRQQKLIDKAIKILEQEEDIIKAIEILKDDKK